MVMKLYGITGSQPFRTVKWLCDIKGVEYEFVKINPGSKKKGGSRSPEFLAKNPNGTVPTIEEDDGFVLTEMNAILTYLAEKHGWEDLYPKDPRKRGIMNQFLHYHHENTRTFTIALFAPVLRPDLKIPAEKIEQDKKQLQKIASVLDGQLQKTGKFIVGDDLTLADFVVYGELGQCRDRYLGIFDFSKFTAVSEWFKRMEAVADHDAQHKFLLKMKPLFQAKM